MQKLYWQFKLEDKLIDFLHLIKTYKKVQALYLFHLLFILHLLLFILFFQAQINGNCFLY